MEKTCKLVITGGGSGGHIYPGIAAAEYLTAHGTVTREQVLWICSSGGRDAEILDAYGFSAETIPAGKLRRYVSMDNITDIGKTLKGFTEALGILRRSSPLCVFSKGGYVSVPVVSAAWILGIPVVTHESDFDPGLATRINQYFSRIICVPYEASVPLYHVAGRVRVTGNPVGRKPPAVQEPLPSDIPQDGVCILVHGGSLGSCSLNSIFWSMLHDIPDSATCIHVLGHQEKRPPPEKRGYYPVTYLEGAFQQALGRADLVISRSGAGTLWEQALAGKAMVLFPLGSGVSRGEQERNARYFADRNAALCFSSDGMDTQQAICDILTLIDNPEKRESLAENALLLVHDKGAQLVAECLEEYLLPGP